MLLAVSVLSAPRGRFSRAILWPQSLHLVHLSALSDFLTAEWPRGPANDFPYSRSAAGGPPPLSHPKAPPPKRPRRAARSPDAHSRDAAAREAQRLLMARDAGTHAGHRHFPDGGPQRGWDKVTQGNGGREG